MVASMRPLLTTWRRESAAHPSVLVLTAAAVLGLSAGGLLVAAGLALVGQLVAGLAVAPLSLALYLCLLPAGPWPDDGGGRGPGSGDHHPDAPGPVGLPDQAVDWERFEREFWAYVEEHALVA
jgi:hypothetical protein